MNAHRFRAAVAAYAPVEAEYHIAGSRLHNGEISEAEADAIAARLRPLARELAAAADDLLGRGMLAGDGANALAACYTDQVEVLESGKAYTADARALAERCFKAKKRIAARLGQPATAEPRSAAKRDRLPAIDSDQHEKVLAALVRAGDSGLMSRDLQVPGLTVDKTKWNKLNDLRKHNLAELPEGSKRWQVTEAGRRHHRKQIGR